MTFEDWWALYPRKVARAEAKKAWSRMSDADRAAAMEALPAHVRYWEAAGTGREYIPHPATWLRGERWADEIAMPEVERKVVAWWATDAGVLAKGREVGCAPRPGEDMVTYKQRVVDAMRRAA